MFAEVCDIKKKITNGNLEVHILHNAESFFYFFKEGVEGADDDTPVHFVSRSAYFARRTRGCLWCTFFQSAEIQPCSLIYGNGPE